MKKVLARLTKVLLLMVATFSIVLGSYAQDTKIFSVSLTGDSIVPMIETTATGGAGAVLRGNKLSVRGNFSNLTGNLRDYKVDPLVPPNPKITSAVHIHRGAMTENGPFQYALEVNFDAPQRKGSFQGEFDLTSEQLQALMNGQLYLDLHTTSFRGGELRGAFRPS